MLAGNCVLFAHNIVANSIKLDLPGFIIYIKRLILYNGNRNNATIVFLGRVL